MKKLFISLLLLMLLLSGCSKSRMVNEDNPIDTDLKNVQTGDVITFGRYEQDNDKYNGAEKIEWIVLAKEDNKILVISLYALDAQPYNMTNENVTWEACSLRSWLNSSFLNTAFTEAEQKLILTSTVAADKNPEYITSPGADIEDKVFLLSIKEAEKYFDSDSSRTVSATEYAKRNGADVADNQNSWWWLRSPGETSDHAAYINYSGWIVYFGRSVDNDSLTVRPALWLEIDN